MTVGEKKTKTNQTNKQDSGFFAQRETEMIA